MFWKELDSLFDIANQNLMQMMTIEEDKQFILAQRAGRQCCTLSVDQKLTRTEKKFAEQRAKEKERKKKQETRKVTSKKATLPLTLRVMRVKKKITSLKALY